jgi:hypothetical protein
MMVLSTIVMSLALCVSEFEARETYSETTTNQTATLTKKMGINTQALQWLHENVQSQIKYLRHPTPPTLVNKRDLPNGALSVLLLADETPLLHPGSPSSLTPDSAACQEALGYLHDFGSHFDMSFGGQAIPLIYHNYLSCFNNSELNWFMAAINVSLPQSVEQATSQEVSYNNMWLMAATETILFGEMFPGPRGTRAAGVGYYMLEKWANYAKNAAVHEFNSPTYTYVQVTSLYTGYIHTANNTAQKLFEFAIDLILCHAIR